MRTWDRQTAAGRNVKLGRGVQFRQRRKHNGICQRDKHRTGRNTSHARAGTARAQAPPVEWCLSSCCCAARTRSVWQRSSAWAAWLGPTSWVRICKGRQGHGVLREAKGQGWGRDWPSRHTPWLVKCVCNVPHKQTLFYHHVPRALVKVQFVPAGGGVQEAMGTCTCTVCYCAGPPTKPLVGPNPGETREPSLPTVHLKSHPCPSPPASRTPTRCPWPCACSFPGPCNKPLASCYHILCRTHSNPPSAAHLRRRPPLVGAAARRAQPPVELRHQRRLGAHQPTLQTVAPAGQRALAAGLHLYDSTPG